MANFQVTVQSLESNMPFALLLIGIVLVVAAVRNTTGILWNGNPGTSFKGIKGDFTGDNNFTYWLASILLIGAIGYVKPLQPLSRVFLVLLVVVLVVSHGGLFDKFNQQVFGGTLGTSTPTLGGAGSIQSGNQ